MPLFRHDGDIYFFAHVPKSGGSTIEHGLQDAGLTLSFLDADWRGPDVPDWNRSSPQHVPRDVLARLFAPGFFDHSFACMRDPVDRFLSAFNFNRNLDHIPHRQSLRRFLDRLESSGNHFENRFDNHFLPADRLVPEGCTVFHLEHGLAPLAAWLKKRSGGAITVDFGHHNKFIPAPPNRPKGLIDTIISDAPETDHITADMLEGDIRDWIKDLYAADYRRFY